MEEEKVENDKGTVRFVKKTRLSTRIGPAVVLLVLLYILFSHRRRRSLEKCYSFGDDLES